MPFIEQTLEEEKEADEKLTRLAEQINAQAANHVGTSNRRRNESKGTPRRAA